MEAQNEGQNNVFNKFLCETDVHSVLISKKYAEDHFPRLAPGNSKILEFEDHRGNHFRMEFVHTNFGYYYLRTGWQRCKDEHKLTYGDMISLYKKKNQNANDTGSEDFGDHQDLYVIICWKLVTKDEEDARLIISQLIALRRDPSASISMVEERVVVKNLRNEDLYENFNGLQLPKKQVEKNLNELPFELPLPGLGGEITLLIFDPIGEKVLVMELMHTEQDKYYLGGRGIWKEYAAQHNLLIFDTVFVSKVTVNRDELSLSAECIWEKVIDQSQTDDQLVNNSYYYEITYQRTSSVKTNTGDYNSKGGGYGHSSKRVIDLGFP